jgi:Uma2 family endonuclease
MSYAVCDPISAWTAGQVLSQFGDVPLSRVRLDREPGAATEQDVLDLYDREDRLYELVDGMLLEKTVGSFESYLALEMGFLIRTYLEKRNLGIVLGADGMMRLAPGLVRIPDVSFISWERLPEGKVPDAPIWGLVPDLAIEIISPGNTRREMERKLHDFFDAGVRRVWYAYPSSREIHVYSAVDRCETFGESQTLETSEVLPGFRLDVRTFFAKPAAPGTK